ncbi:hypothetical protein ACFL1B_06325 [Nanoarchaeota archaeon]
MAPSININKEAFVELWNKIKLFFANIPDNFNKLLDYLKKLPYDELGAWIAVALGCVLFLVGLILL